MNKKRVCIDVGGTFTDCLVMDETGLLQKFKASTTPSDPSIGLMNALKKAARHYGARHRRVPRPDRSAGARHDARHQHPDHRARRQGRHDHHQGLPRQHRDAARHQAGRRLALQSVHPAQSAAGPALAPHRRRGAHAGRRQHHDAAQRAGGARRGAQIPGAGRQVDRHLLPAFLRQPDERAPRRRDRAARLRRRSSSPPRTRRCRSGASSSASTPPRSAPMSARRSRRYLTSLEKVLKDTGFRGTFLMMLANGLVQNVAECIRRPVFLLHSGPAAAPSGAVYLGKSSRREEPAVHRHGRHQLRRLHDRRRRHPDHDRTLGRRPAGRHQDGRHRSASAPAAARSPGSIRSACCASDRRAPAPIRARPATATRERRDRHRRQPGPRLHAGRLLPRRRDEARRRKRRAAP